MGTVESDFEAAVGSQANGRGYLVGGLRYMKPVQIGHQSFATTDVDPHDQDDMFVGRTKGLFSIDPTSEGAAAMQD